MFLFRKTATLHDLEGNYYIPQCL